MKTVQENKKVKFQLTFTTGFSFTSSLTWKELKKLIHTYKVIGYKEVEEVVADV